VQRTQWLGEDIGFRQGEADMKAAAHSVSPDSGSGRGGITSFISRTIAHWSDRRMVHAISQLDDHLLADIGLSRADLDWALHQPSSGRPSEELARLAAERRARRNRRAI
jgi:uncharacterized protein YjiS (DUF1127 family)